MRKHKNTKASGVMASELNQAADSHRSGIIQQLQDLEQLALSLQPALFGDVKAKRKRVSLAQKKNASTKLWTNLRQKEATMESCPDQAPVMLANSKTATTAQKCECSDDKHDEKCRIRTDQQV